MTKLTATQRNVLEAIGDATRTKTGRTKARVPAESYFANVVSALHAKGAIDWADETIYGTGYALTPDGAQLIGRK